MSLKISKRTKIEKTSSPPLRFANVMMVDLDVKGCCLGKRLESKGEVKNVQIGRSPEKQQRLIVASSLLEGRACDFA